MAARPASGYPVATAAPGQGAMAIYRVAYERFRNLIRPAAGFETLASGFRFTEGVTWHPLRRHVTFSDIPASRIHRWHQADGAVTVLRQPSAMTNGTCYDRSGRLLMCEHESSWVTRLEADGRVTVLADNWRGSPLNSPNDIVVDAAGAVWFTDPLYGRQKETGVPRPPGLPFCGVFRLDAGGRLDLVADDYAAPNGLCFSPDGARLYVNDSERGHIRAYDIAPDGRARGGSVFARTLDADGTLGEGTPDGMKVDAEGNVWCAGPGGIHVFDGTGKALGVVRTPSFPANFCFGGEDMRSLFIAAGATFLRLRTAVAGYQVFAP